MDNKGVTFFPGEAIPASIEYHLFRISGRSRIIYLTFAGIVVFILTSLPLVFVDISISSPGWVHSGSEQQSLISPATGRVIYSCIITDKNVSAGDTLLILDTQTLRSRLNGLTYKQQENSKAVIDLKQLIRLDNPEELPFNVTLNTEKYKSEYDNFLQHYRYQQTMVDQVNTEYARIKHLFVNGVLAASDYEASLFLLQQEMAKKESVLLQQLSKWQSDLKEKQILREAIKAEVDHVLEEIDKCYLLSPMSGSIIQSAGLKEGTLISANQWLADLSPTGELIVVASVSPADIGYLFEGQEVRVAVDAYNHNRWGMIQANIMEISGDVVLDPLNNRPYYRVKCHLDADSLVHRNGSVGRLRKGMTVNCRMLKTRKSLLQLMTNRADQLFNPANNKKY